MLAQAELSLPHAANLQALWLLRRRLTFFVNITGVRRRRAFVLEDWWDCLTFRRNTKGNRLQCRKKKARVGSEEQVLLHLGWQGEIWSSCLGLAISLGLVGQCLLLGTSDDFDLCSC